MTILVAASNKDSIILMSDSLASEGETMYNATRKIIQANNFAIGFAGTSFLKQIIELHKDTIVIDGVSFQDYQISNELDCYKLWKEITKTLNDAGCTGEEVKGYANSFDMSLIVITKSKKIFVIDAMGLTTEFPHFSALGSGRIFASGIIEYAYMFDQKTWQEDIESIVHRVIYLTNQNVLTCGGDYVYSIKFEDGQESVQGDDASVQTLEADAEASA